MRKKLRRGKLHRKQKKQLIARNEHLQKQALCLNSVAHAWQRDFGVQVDSTTSLISVIESGERLNEAARTTTIIVIEYLLWMKRKGLWF